MKAIQSQAPGGSETMQYVDVPTPAPAAGEVLVRQAAAGINFIDVYQRQGIYSVPFPLIPGNEGAGVVEAVGEGVTELAVGDRVAYTGTPGAYAEYIKLSAQRAVKVPDGMELEQAAAIMLQGMTAHYLVNDSYALKPGDVCLIHAGAGGVGLLLTQMAKAKGAKVVSTVGTEAKAELARQAGADEVILYTQEDFVEAVKQRVGEKKLNVIYDSVGKDTFVKGLELLKPRGLGVIYGQSSGVVPPFDLQLLNQHGSLFVQRPSLFVHIATREELVARATDVMTQVSSGKLNVRIGASYPLAEAKQAHDDLEGRKTTGKLLLIP